MMGAGKIELSPSEEFVLNKIYLIRGQKVMLDFDLAELYDIETKRLKEAVKRNTNRFPPDFMFEIGLAELEPLRSQFATSKRKGGNRYSAMVFTEQGVAMLSSILNSEIAIKVNIQIIRVFTKTRELLFSYKEILLKLENIEKKSEGYDNDIAAIFSCLKRLVNEPQAPKRRIGFRQDESEE
jgi:hypothetical protein